MDPSAKSFHLGNYQAGHVVALLKKYGHPTIFIVGGITGLIGDPRDPKLSKGAALERAMKTKEEIKKNVEALTIQAKNVFNADEVINNADFYEGMSVSDYLRDIGKMINVNYLLEKEVISRRLETGISYAEFSYTLLQGYDSLYLYQNKDV
jgi:tyrosyl-tRNA synthetase